MPLDVAPSPTPIPEDKIAIHPPAMSVDAAASPTPVPEDKIAIRVICWYKDHQAPEVMMAENVRGEPLSLAQAGWLKTLCRAGDKAASFIDLWSELNGDWAMSTLDTLVVATQRTTMAVLLRLPHVTFCEGLGVELSLLEQARGCYAFAKLEQFDLTSKNAGRQVKLAIWNEHPEHEAKVYAISLSPEDTFTVTSHPALLQQCVSVVGLLPTPVLFEVWDVNGERWIAKKIGEAIAVAKGFDLVLIRHPRNCANVGLGYAVHDLQVSRVVAQKKAKFASLKEENDSAGESLPKAKRRRIVNPANRPPPAGQVVIDLT